MRGRQYHHDVYNFLLIFYCLILIAGCCERYKMLTKDIEDASTMKEIMDKHIPLYSSASQARSFLKLERFTCLDKENYFTDEKYKEDDFIFCERREGGTIVFDRWVIIVAYDVDGIREVKVDRRYYDMFNKEE